MGFLSPPKPSKPANTPVTANYTADTPPVSPLASSLINTGPVGLQTKASTQRTSLLGGS